MAYDSQRFARLAISAMLLAGVVTAEVFPDGPGRAEMEKICTQCHDLAKSVSVRQDRNGWGATLAKMVGMGMKATDEELRAVLGYLELHFAPEALPPVKINSARAIELESRFSLKRSEASAILRYRRANGPFRSLDDLKKVPGIDFTKIESRKERLSFE